MPDSYDYAQPPETEREAQPLLTYALCCLCLLMTTAYLTSDWIVAPLWQQLGRFGLATPDQIWDGQYWGLLTAFFVHANLLHLLFNLVWLWRLGALVERTLPPLVYILFLIGAAVLAGGTELAVSGQIGMGASGVVYALIGLLWAGRGRYPAWQAAATRETLNIFLIWGVFCAIATYTDLMAIANGAHAGGFLFGLSVGWLFYAPRRRLIWAVPLTALAGLTVLALVWMPWSGSWNFWKGNQEFARGHYAEAIPWYRRALRWGTDEGAAWSNIGAAWHNIGVTATEKGRLEEAERAFEMSQVAQARAKFPSRREPSKPPPF